MMYLVKMDFSRYRIWWKKKRYTFGIKVYLPFKTTIIHHKYNNCAIHYLSYN